MADKLILDALIKREDFEINKDIDVPISDMKSTNPAVRCKVRRN